MNAPTDEMRRKATELRLRWMHAPALFFREALGVSPWDMQVKIAESVDRNRRTAVKSGQKVGKSALIAWVAIWWLFTRLTAKVILTAPGEAQVKNILWPEVRSALGLVMHRPPLRLVEPSWCAVDPRTGLRLPDGRSLFCVTTDTPERMQGLSGAEILFCIDEGSGYPDDMWAPIEGNMAGGGHMFTTSNPTQTSGKFFEAFHTQSKFYSLHSISSWDTPNARAGRMVIPGLALREYCEEMREKWGEESPEYQMRILGRFPSQGSTAVIALALVEQANERWEKATRRPDGSVEKPYGHLSIGVDVGRFGDDPSVIACSRDHIGWTAKRISGQDGNVVAAEVAVVIRAERQAGETVTVKVDVIGVGASVFDALVKLNDEDALGPGVTIIAVNVAETADDEAEYHLLRDQLWFGIQAWLKQGGTLEPHDDLRSELIAPFYGFDPRGRRKVESKKDMKKRLGRSPDHADALGLAVYAATTRIQDTDVPGAEESRWGDTEGRGFG